MKIGKISESVLKRTIIKEIKYKRKDVKKGASVGNDGAVFASLGRDMASSVATYSGDFLLSSRRAFAAAVNSVASKGAEPAAVMVSILMPVSEKESHLRSVMTQLNSLGESMNVQIAGGHTETSENVAVPVVTVTAFGYMYENYIQGDGKSDITAGMDVVMIGEAGLEGTAVLATEREDQLRERFNRSYINRAKEFADEILTADEAAVAVRHGAKAMHDTSKGGVFGALWELGEYLKCGMNIDLKAIPIRQETVEICEYFDMNPYFIHSQGGIIIVTDRGEELVQTVRRSGKTAEIIGCTAEGHDKAVINNDEKRFLEPPKAGKKEYNI